MIILPVNLGTIYIHTQVIYQNKKQVINDKINIYITRREYCACMKIQGNIAVY